MRFADRRAAESLQPHADPTQRCRVRPSHRIDRRPPPMLVRTTVPRLSRLASARSARLDVLSARRCTGGRVGPPVRECERSHSCVTSSVLTLSVPTQTTLQTTPLSPRRVAVDWGDVTCSHCDIPAAAQTANGIASVNAQHANTWRICVGGGEQQQHPLLSPLQQQTSRLTAATAAMASSHIHPDSQATTIEATKPNTLPSRLSQSIQHSHPAHAPPSARLCSPPIHPCSPLLPR